IGFWGWYQWLRGGKNATPRPITHISRRLAVILVIITPICTVLATLFVTAVNGSAPFWDTFTTVLSLVATYVMGLRHIEHWFIWISADLIYVALFASQGFYLTSILSVIYLMMSLRGSWEWRNEIRARGGIVDTGSDRREVLPVS